MVTIYHKTINDEMLNRLDSYKTGSWINVEDPSSQELKELSKKHKLDLGLLKDAVDPFEVPRLEVDDGTIYIYTRIPHNDRDGVITVPVLIAVAKGFVLTVSRRPLPFLQKFVHGVKDVATTQKGKFVLQILSEITAGYNSFVSAISKKVRGTTVKLQNIRNNDIIQFVRLEEYLNDFLAALNPTDTILNNLLSGKYLDFYEDDRDLIEDLELSNGQSIESIKSNLKNIVNTREAYSTIMTHDLNRIIKVLTVLTILLNVPVLVASLYGMNVALPFANSPVAFWWIIFGTGAISIVLLLSFIRNKWL